MSTTSTTDRSPRRGAALTSNYAPSEYNEYRIGLPELSKRWALLFVLTILYYAVGCIYYKYGSDDLNWNVLQAVYFTTISITTVGYGDEVPTSTKDRIFTMFYVAVGILVIMNAIAQAVGAVLETIERASMRRRAFKNSLAQARINTTTGRDSFGTGRDSFGGAAGDRQKSTTSSALQSIATKRPELMSKKRSALAKLMYREFSWFFSAVVMIFIGAVVVYFWEGDYSFIDAVFWAFQTCTTIGYGEERIQNRGVRAFVIPYALFSSIGWAYVISKMVGTSSEVTYVRRREALLEARLDQALVMCLDRDGGGIDKAEFIVGMLRILGHVTDEDVEPWFQRFEELDAQGTGKLDATDVAVVAREAAIEARRRSVAPNNGQRPLSGRGLSGLLSAIPKRLFSGDDNAIYTPFISPEHGTLNLDLPVDYDAETARVRNHPPSSDASTSVPDGCFSEVSRGARSTGPNASVVSPPSLISNPRSHDAIAATDRKTTTKREG
eukprot:CAMPEP_0198657736 /NCGR_PEP_ID=MMETSP1467-20131203/19028_1 /TAXON_ID=1462469 /ORGANISM="unid. sp., Strain CCMP2135" /LENGTH=495 /DNA_ID=CAMNT_0044393955 /DNA_START=35 /DNA_END=1522 /DNA_ORIENTATION=+